MSRYKLEDGNILEVLQDDSPANPREDDNLGTMLCFHNRYTLGDKTDYTFHPKNYTGWKDMEKAVAKYFNTAIILPIYMYDHSGITIKTTPFSCPWDSGQIGFIFIPKSKVRSEYSKKRISKQLRDKICTYLIGEVATYDQYLTGDVYGFNVLDTEGNHVDSCWGFYGHNPKENGIQEHVNSKILEEI